MYRSQLLPPYQVHRFEQQLNQMLTSGVPTPSKFSLCANNFKFQPLIVNKTLSGTLHIQNTRSSDWMAVRVIVYSVCMKVFPRKFLVPPARKAAVDISIVWIPTCPRQYSLIVQWFPVGSDCPPCNSELIWKKPYRKISRKRWSQRVVCVYFEPGMFHFIG
uniref:Major sperm protein n=1 Tax=Ascaris lumbricoides TaxID=6252 RepID=A0A0M3HS87_ASCLU